MFSPAQLDQLEALALASIGRPPVAACCWAWVHCCYAHVGVLLPTNVWAARALFVQVPLPGVPGDVLHAWVPGAAQEHLGVRLRGARMTDYNLHGGGVCLQDLTRPPWPRALRWAWRLCDEWRERCA